MLDVLSLGFVRRSLRNKLAFSAAPLAKLSSLDEVEREQVIRVLAATDNHKGRAAEILGVSRPRLRRLMEKYDLE